MELALLSPGVGAAVLNVAVAPDGRPATESVTGLLYAPFTATTTIAYDTFPPGFTISEVSAEPTTKSVCEVTVTVTPAEVDALKFVSPVYLAVTVCVPTDNVSVNVAMPLALTAAVPSKFP